MKSANASWVPKIADIYTMLVAFHTRELLEYIGSLFLSGTFSDVCIVILDKKYNLHRAILSQNPYFQVLFSGKWRDADSKTIEICIDNPDINSESVEVCFKFLYGLGIGSEEDTDLDLTSILAASLFFQIDALQSIVTCRFCASLVPSRVVEYLAVSSHYDCNATIEEACLSMLLREGVNEEIDHSLLPDHVLKFLFCHRSFWMRDEKERYTLFKTIVARRLEMGNPISVKTTSEILDSFYVENLLGEVECELFAKEHVSQALGKLEAVRKLATTPKAALWAPPFSPEQKVEINFRFGEEFELDIATIRDGLTLEGRRHYFAGSLWCFKLKVTKECDDPVDLNMFVYHETFVSDDTSQKSRGKFDKFVNPHQITGFRFAIHIPRESQKERYDLYHPTTANSYCEAGCGWGWKTLTTIPKLEEAGCFGRTTGTKRRLRIIVSFSEIGPFCSAHASPSTIKKLY